MDKLIVLGIESTSHTFGVGIAALLDGKPAILANVVDRFVPRSGGIHPREAALHHAEVAPRVLKAALSRAGLGVGEIDGVAAALGPGLGPCLRVGASLARFIAAYYDKPLVPVNHAVAHIEIGKMIHGLVDPLVIYVSGGNTLVAVQRRKRYRVLGETLDIPLGNLLDTFAREAGIAPPYIVGGRHVVDICSDYGSNFIDLPYTVKGNDLSFSGLLTAALRRIGGRRGKIEELGDICLSLRETAYNMLVEVSERALALTGKREVILVGGVAASKVLNEKMEEMARLHGASYYTVPPEYAGDNGAMIAWTGLLGLVHGISIEPERAFIRQRWRLDEVDLPWLPPD